MNPAYLTVVFIDIVDFTTLSEILVPSDLVCVIGEAMEGMSSILTTQGATVDKYIGDCVMALFNVPEELPRHESRACQSALECIKYLHKMGASWKERGLPALACRVGIHSGHALVGNFGSSTRLNFTAIVRSYCSIVSDH
jgi:adenylate cyclase